jgi:hypothetical protein
MTLALAKQHRYDRLLAQVPVRDMPQPTSPIVFFIMSLSPPLTSSPFYQRPQPAATIS